MQIRKRIWLIVEAAKKGDNISRAFDIFIISLILLSIISIVLESVHGICQSCGRYFKAFEIFSIIVFTIEYVMRLWSCVEDNRYHRPVWGRIRFAFRFLSVIDLMAFLPFYLPFIGVDLRFMRVIRLLRILRIIKIGRYYASMNLIAGVLKSKKEELVLSTIIMLFLLLMSSCMMFHCEHDAQPQAFPNIPATMWWSVATLTTVGYGDVYPITSTGKFFAAIISILGIGMFALPTGILGSAFVEEIQKKKSKENMICPHCGKSIK